MAIRVAAWNLERGGLGDPGRSSAMTNKILSLRADVVILPEAYNEDSYYDLVDVAKQRFMDEGHYSIAETLYKDDDKRKDRRAIMMLNRSPSAESNVVDLGTRQALSWSIVDIYTNTDVKIVGLHLDDRAEARRAGQALELLEGLQDESQPCVIAGDFNAMHRSEARSALARAAGPIAEILPYGEPGFESTMLARLGSLARRLSGMADGTTLQLFEAAGYHESDSFHLHTTGFVQLLHILHTAGLYSPPDSFQSIKAKRLSDHRIISAIIET